MLSAPSANDSIVANIEMSSTLVRSKWQPSSCNADNELRSVTFVPVRSRIFSVKSRERCDTSDTRVRDKSKNSSAGSSLSGERSDAGVFQSNNELRNLR